MPYTPETPQEKEEYFSTFKIILDELVRIMNKILPWITNSEFGKKAPEVSEEFKKIVQTLKQYIGTPPDMDMLNLLFIIERVIFNEYILYLNKGCVDKFEIQIGCIIELSQKYFDLLNFSKLPERNYDQAIKEINEKIEKAGYYSLDWIRTVFQIKKREKLSLPNIDNYISTKKELEEEKEKFKYYLLNSFEKELMKKSEEIRPWVTPTLLGGGKKRTKRKKRKKRKKRTKRTKRTKTK